MSAAVRATSGAAIRQGPHQAAQKSIKMGTLPFCTISSINDESTSSGSSSGGIGFLQAPQRPLSAKFCAGIRFFVPQYLQVRTTGISQKLRSGKGQRIDSLGCCGYGARLSRHLYVYRHRSIAIFLLTTA